ncbi:hypothetical protein Plhal304r1_c007g0026961 [Plasmopara halstedii]
MEIYGTRLESIIIDTLKISGKDGKRRSFHRGHFQSRQDKKDEVARGSQKKEGRVGERHVRRPSTGIRLGRHWLCANRSSAVGHGNFNACDLQPFTTPAPPTFFRHEVVADMPVLSLSK